MPALPEGVGVSTFSLLQPLSRPVAWTVGRSHSPMLGGGFAPLLAADPGFAASSVELRPRARR